MPFPIIHSFAGYSIYKLSAKSNSDPSWKLLVLSIFLANLADLDFLPGVLSGNALRFHHHSTHSLAACLRVHDFRSFFLFFLDLETLHMLFFEMFAVFLILTLVTVLEESKMKLSLKRSMALVRFAQAMIFFVGFVMT